MAKAKKKKAAPKKKAAKASRPRAAAKVRKAAKPTKRAAPKAGKRTAPKAPKRAGKAGQRAAAPAAVKYPPPPVGTVVPETPTRAQSSAVAPASAGQPELQVSNEAVEKATGRNWAQWCEALDGAGAQGMAHSDIARLVFERFRVGPWWSQMVTVGYEQMRGMRVKHQRPDGFSVSATKTLAAHPERVYAAWNVDAERSRWLGSSLKVRSATPPKSIRLAGSDGVSLVTVMLYPKGKKTQVSVQHDKLKDSAEAARMKTYWATALDRLDTAVKG